MSRFTWSVTLLGFATVWLVAWLVRDELVREDAWRRDCIKTGRQLYAEYNGGSCTEFSK
jgi:hypothetical protein